MSNSQGVIFLKKKNVNKESKWFEDGDEENDGKYVGEIENGKPNGTGSITFPDGQKYEGEWKDGKRNGQGTYTFRSGAKYVGEHKDGKKHGQGTYTYTDGRKYVGEFKNGNFWNGTTYKIDGNIFEEWVNGKFKLK